MMQIVAEAAGEQLVWSEGFATGVDEVDRQLRQLLVLVDQVRELVAEQQPEEQQARLGQMLDQLNEQATCHFVTEEELLRGTLRDHPGSNTHIRAHRSYWSTVAGLQRRLRYNDDDVSTELYAFLRQWWIGHILTADQQMGSALRTLGLAR